MQTFPILSAFPPAKRQVLQRFWARWNSHISRKVLVYLDINFWIDLTDANQSRSGKYFKLLEFLRLHKYQGSILCPASGIQIDEAKKQNDSTSKLAMAALMDDLGDGFGLGNTLMVYHAEWFALGYLRDPRNPQAIPDVRKFIWRRGHHRIIDGYFERTDSAFSFARTYWVFANQTLTSILSELQFTSAQHFQETAEKLFREKQGYRDQYKTFKELRGIEIAGHFKAMIELDPKLPIEGSFAMPNYDDPKQFMTQSIPASQTYASVMACLRHDLARRYSPNDLFDAEHAAMALAYHDVFLTEKSLYSTIKNNLKNHDISLNAEIVHDVDAAIEAIERKLRARNFA